MKLPSRLSNVWHRYLTWRKGEDVRPPKLPEAPINKLAIDDGDVASIVTANQSGSGGYSG